MKFILSLILMAFTLQLKAQIPDHVPLMTSSWNLLDTKVYKPNKYGVYFVYFPPPLQAMNKKIIELPGYMIPIKAGILHPAFMLSVLPVLQCQFCGQANIPAMVMIQMAKPAVYSENPVKVKGTLILNGTDDSQPEFALINATLEEVK